MIYTPQPERLLTMPSELNIMRFGLEYASTVCDTSAQLDIKTLEKVQHRTARFMTRRLA